MSNITFNIELDNYKKKDGTANIQIRITQNRKSRRITIGVSILPDHWNPEKQEVRKGDPNYRQINSLIKSKLLELERTYLESSILNKTVTANSLTARLKREVTGDSFLTFADQRIKNMVSPWTRKSQDSVIKKLRDYLGRDVTFLEIDYQFLVNYERYPKKVGNGINTIHANMKTLKAIYNEAMKSGFFVPENGSPWVLYRPKKGKSSRSKLTEAQILKIEQLDVRMGINEWHSKNIFLMSFYLQGMRTSDILQLQWLQINGERVEYVAGKTKKYRSKKLIDRAKEILAYYNHQGIKPTDYVFPFLKGKNIKHYKEEEWVRVLASANALINGHLQSIAEKIGVNKISMHVARHSFADIANKKTGNVYAVSDALDHSSVSVTTDYLNSSTRSENDDLVDTVFLNTTVK